ncbi:hypothetical protein C8035_v002791 [Colletotrichum spinosum]|uniref:C3H1-type domain-containing protein n=1 Tax=Colletotrichum spinosum TaxID=1347390 RepID=A0A4R8Q4M7_9PEZI|nr:hypothetical protein C8035_v002791 [Colletotrichum spinosum]
MPPMMTGTRPAGPNAPLENDRRGLSQSIHNPDGNVNNTNEPGTASSWPSRTRPEHFIVRKGPSGSGAIVPLIPVDLLPDYVQVTGVPRELTIGQTVGMSNLGEFPRPIGRFQLNFVSLGTEANKSDPRQEVVAAGAGAETVIVPSTQAQPPPPPPPAVMLPPRRKLDWAEDTESVSTDNFSGADSYSESSDSNNNISKRRVQNIDSAAAAAAGTKTLNKATSERAQRMLNIVAATGRPASAPTTTIVGSNKKAAKPVKSKFTRPPGSLCRHWCQTGQCGWGNECRYTHQMPVTLEGLADVGLAELPSWWRRAAGLPVEGTIDVRIFSAATMPVPSVAALGNVGGKKSPGGSGAGGSTAAAVGGASVAVVKKNKTKPNAEERRLAEEMHLLRLSVEKSQAGGGGAGEPGKKRVGNGQVQTKKMPSQQLREVEKLVDV